MQITSNGVEIAGTGYTWQQTWRFFLIGVVWAVVGASPPVLVTLWDDYYHYADPIDWRQIWILAVASLTPALVGYWRKHKALLKIPPFFTIPPEFHPSERRTEVVEERGPHTTEIVKGTGDGTVIEKLSEHESKVTTKTLETIAPSEPPSPPPAQGV